MFASYSLVDPPVKGNHPLIVTSVSSAYIELLPLFVRFFKKYGPRDREILLYAEVSSEELMQLRRLLPSWFTVVRVELKSGIERPFVGPKWCVYSTPLNFPGYPSYVYLDLDTWVCDDLAKPIAQSTEAGQPTILCTPEHLSEPTDLLTQMFHSGGMYHGTYEERRKFFSSVESSAAARWKIPINTGVMFLNYEGAKMLAVSLERFCETSGVEWLRSKSHDGAYTGHREQAVVNLVIARLCDGGFLQASFLGEEYNYQMMHHPGGNPSAKILHFNGMFASTDSPSKRFYNELSSDILQG